PGRVARPPRPPRTGGPRGMSAAASTNGYTDSVNILKPVWPGEGGRHPAFRALAGTLLRSGMPPDAATHFVAELAEATGDEEAEKRAGLVADTAARLQQGKNVTGLPTLMKRLGPDGGR